LNFTSGFSKADGWGAGLNSKGRVGLSQPGFTGAGNNCPFASWAGLMSYPQLVGKSTVTNVTFANFGTSCSTQTDAIITPQSGNDDGQFPVTFSNIRLHNVLNASKVD